MMLLALAAAMGMTFGTAAFAEEAKTETKTITVDGEELTVEVTDIGKQGTFTYWSAFTGDSQTWISGVSMHLMRLIRILAFR